MTGRLASSGSGNAVVVPGEPIQPSQGCVKIPDDGQVGLNVTDAQNSLDNSVVDDRPVHIPSRALNTEVVQGGKTAAAEKVDSAQIEDELRGGARMALDEPAEGLTVGSVDVT